MLGWREDERGDLGAHMVWVFGAEAENMQT